MDFKGWSDVPADILKSMQYFGAAGHTKTVKFRCQAFRVIEGGVLYMCGVLVDTSDEVNGTVIEPRVSHVEDLYIGCQPWNLRTISLEEK
jgi:hypothetical protein